MTLLLVKLRPLSKLLFRKPLSFDAGKDHIAHTYKFPPYNTIMGAIAFKIVERSVSDGNNVKSAEEVLTDEKIKIITYGYFHDDKILVPAPMSVGMKLARIGEEYIILLKEPKKELKELKFVDIDAVKSPHDLNPKEIIEPPFTIEYRPGVGLDKTKRAREGWLYIAEFLHLQSDRGSDSSSGIWILLEDLKDMDIQWLSKGDLVYMGGKGGVLKVDSVKKLENKSMNNNILNGDLYWALSLGYSVFKGNNKFYDAPKNSLIKLTTGTEMLSSVTIDQNWKINARERTVAVAPGSSYLIKKVDLHYLYYDQDQASNATHKVIDFFGKPLLYFLNDFCPRNAFLLLEERGGECFHGQ